VPNAVTILPSPLSPLGRYLHRRADGLERGSRATNGSVREEMKFYAPVPVSVEEMDDNRAMIIEDLVGKQLRPDAVERPE